MLAELLSIKFIIVYVLVASATFVHFRGQVRHRFTRQLTDHSTFIAPYNALIYLFSAVPAKPILDRADFPELDLLQDNWKTIRDEAVALYEDGHIRAADGRNDLAFNTFFKRGWTRFYLKWYNDGYPSAEKLCPKTVELVRQIPTVHAAMFAVLPARGRLGAHRDPFGGALRYHLGLVTPNSEDCRIYIDNERYAWYDGDDLLFDETYIHRVENDTDDYRIILFCDVERPIRNPVVRAINRFMINHIVKASATRNVPGEKIGFLNRLFVGVSALGDMFARIKAWNRTFYYTGKYVLFALAGWFLLIRPLLMAADLWPL
ncbi:MAG TPA: aspartyl/asparaginyl beta-hydroxylase domain-containing protein [Wenzhouxiangella sp.]|nr:aspartyl/asparaginyl beta-hydroxylase domain-containing protein [Wenzhouxiangella sp.]